MIMELLIMAYILLGVTISSGLAIFGEDATVLDGLNEIQMLSVYVTVGILWPLALVAATVYGLMVLWSMRYSLWTH